MTIRDLAIAKLQQLSEPLLQEVNNYIDSIIHKHYATTADSQQCEKLVAVWEKWFNEVDRLEVTTPEITNEYQSLLLKKYRQQGLTL
jgi:hypothetical protein